MDSTQLRCSGCNALLATEDDGGLTIRRGGLHATIPGAPSAAITCYRCCRTNAFTLAAGRSAQKDEPPDTP